MAGCGTGSGRVANYSRRVGSVTCQNGAVFRGLTSTMRGPVGLIPERGTLRMG